MPVKSNALKPQRHNDPGEIIMPRGLYITTKISEELMAKQHIAEVVVGKYIHDFDAVLLDAGSTAELIAEKMFASRRFLSVMTNNMGAYAAYTRASGQLEPKDDGNPDNHGNELLISGGRYVDVYESLLGDMAIASFSSFSPNIVIIGTSGLRCEEGIFCHGSEEAAVKNLLWNKPTDTRLIATDWTKIGKRDARSFGSISQLCAYSKKTVIVTTEPPREMYDKYPDRVREFDNQLKKMEKECNVIIERIKIPRHEAGE